MIAAKKPVADHKKTTRLMKLYLWMVYYTEKDVGTLC